MSQPHRTPELRRASHSPDKMSQERIFDRRRSASVARRGHVHTIDRDAFLRRWSLLMIASFSTREECAVYFDVTYQTSCNWFDGLCRPYGDIVDHAVATLPRYAEIMQGR